MTTYSYISFFPDVWIAATHHLTHVRRCIYHDLLMVMWMTPGCRVPDDDAWLGNRLKLSADEVRNELRPLLLEFCQTRRGFVSQKRLMKEWVAVKNRSQKAGSSAKSRWNKEKDVCDRNARASGQALLSIPIPISKAIANKKEKISAASAAGQDLFQPTDPEVELFRRGKEVLGQNAGGLIVKLLKARGSVQHARASIEIAETKQDPREYIGALLRGNGHGDYDDPNGYSAARL